MPTGDGGHGDRWGGPPRPSPTPLKSPISSTTRTGGRHGRRTHMYRQHFGLTAAPLANDRAELWDDGVLARLEERFNWLLQSPGIGLLTGAPGVG